MKRIELYSNTAIQAIVHIPNFSSEEYEDRFDEILSMLADKDVNIEDLTDTKIDQENNIVNLFFLQEGEVLVYSDEQHNSIPEMRVGEYIIFNEDIAKSFNKADEHGSKDFASGDEIKISGISHMYGDSPLLRYRLETYVVQQEPVEIFLEDVSMSDESEVKDNG